MANDLVFDGDQAYNDAVEAFGTEWHRESACLTAPPGAAFGTGHAARVFIRDYCESCSVRSTCLAFAVTAGIEHGVWGGIGTPAARAAAMRREDR